MVDFDCYDIEETNGSPLTNKKFVKFLKDNKIYDKFIYNLKQEISHSHGYYGRSWHSIDTFCDDVSPGNYIIHGFFWPLTPEGRMFWDRHNTVWYLIVRRNRSFNKKT